MVLEKVWRKRNYTAHDGIIAGGDIMEDSLIPLQSLTSFRCDAIIDAIEILQFST